jgi:hypothetical protein
MVVKYRLHVQYPASPLLTGEVQARVLSGEENAIKSKRYDVVKIATILILAEWLFLKIFVYLDKLLCFFLRPASRRSTVADDCRGR